MRFSDILMIFWLAVLAYGAFAFILPTQREINEKQARLESLNKEKNNMASLPDPCSPRCSLRDLR